MISLLLALPLAGAVVVALLPERNLRAIRWLALLVALATLLLAVVLWLAFDPGSGEVQFEERLVWISGINISYHVGVDGLSLPLVLLTALLGLAAFIYSFQWERQPKAFFALSLLMLNGLLGVFVALDLFLFFLFWEVSLIPMYFLISVWGGENRQPAAYKFFVYTLVGSIAMLLVIQLILVAYGTLDIPELAGLKPFAGEDRLGFLDSLTLRRLAFLGFFLAFAIKVPIWPFHTWMPETYLAAPPGVTAVLSGVMAKMGVYGLLRIGLPLFPDVARDFAPWLAVLVLLNIVYGAFVALGQRDAKALVAWSSFNHMGFIALGVFAGAAALTSEADRALALNGAVLQMFNHGITTGALFLLVGMIEVRLGTRLLSEFGGHAARVPVFFGIFLTTVMSSLGLPGLNNFWGEFLILRGAWPAFPVVTVLSLVGILLTAAFLLALVRGFFHGPPGPEDRPFPDLDRRELVTVVPLLVLMVAIGLYPAWFLGVTNASVLALIARLAG